MSKLAPSQLVLKLFPSAVSSPLLTNFQNNKRSSYKNWLHAFKKGVNQFFGDFHFLQDWAIFRQTDLFLLICNSFSKNYMQKLYQPAKIGKHFFTNTKAVYSSNYQTKEVCCHTDIFCKCYRQSQILAVILIVLIPGSSSSSSSSSPPSGNGSVGTSGRFSETD